MSTPLIDEEITRAVIGSCYEVYNTLGYGFLQSVHVSALQLELQDRGRRVGREVQLLHFGHGARFYRCLNPHVRGPAVSGKSI